jgi:hypothetical protein
LKKVALLTGAREPSAASSASTGRSLDGGGARGRIGRIASWSAPRRSCCRQALGFRFPAEQQLHLPVRVELHDHAGHLIDHPNVVLRIDSHLLSHQESVRILSDLANELPGLIELE